MTIHTHFPALPVEGAPDSPVRVLSFEDLECGDCAAWRTMLDEELLPRYGDSVAFDSRDFPLEKHHWADLAAMASRRFCAWDVEAGLEFRRYCLYHRADINSENLPERIAEFARKRGFDVETAVMSLSNAELQEAVRRDVAEGRRRGVRKTPTIFIGDMEFVETFSLHEIVMAIEAVLGMAQSKETAHE